MSIIKCLYSIRSLLSDPNVDEPLVPHIAKLYKTNRIKHDKIANQWAIKYADAKLSGFALKEKTYNILHSCLDNIFGYGVTQIIELIIIEMEGNLIDVLPKNIKKHQQIEEQKEAEKIEKEKQRKQAFEKRGKPNRSVFIKTLTGMTLTLKCWLEDTVLDIKHRIYTERGYSPNSTILIWSGKQLDDYRTLSSYGLSYDVTIHLVVRLRGGIW